MAEGYGNTPARGGAGETLDQRLAQEEPEPDPYLEAAEETEDVGGEVGTERAGRLVDEDEGLGPDEEKDMVGEDVGIDGAGAERRGGRRPHRRGLTPGQRAGADTSSGWVPRSPESVSRASSAACASSSARRDASSSDWSPRSRPG